MHPLKLDEIPRLVEYPNLSVHQFWLSRHRHTCVHVRKEGGEKPQQKEASSNQMLIFFFRPPHGGSETKQTLEII